MTGRRRRGDDVDDVDQAAVDQLAAGVSLVDQLTAALADAPTLPRDAAAVALARRYAAALDTVTSPALLADLGPKYAALLAQLGMTPGSRGKGGASGAHPTTAEPTPAETALGQLRDVASGRTARRRTR